MELKLAAILAAEVVGYRRLMSKDRAGTLAALQEHHHELIDRAIAVHRGRIVALSDARTLAEFVGALDAMECALAIQRGMAARNRTVPPPRQVRLRIGLDYRDVIAAKGDLVGPGIEVARFLRDLVEPGGLCISDSVFLQVRKRVEAGFENLGMHQLEGLTQPVRAIRVVALQSPEPDTARRRGWPWRRPA